MQRPSAEEEAAEKEGGGKGEEEDLRLQLEDPVHQSFVLLLQSGRLPLLRLQRHQHSVTVWTLVQVYSRTERGGVRRGDKVR